MSDLICVTNRRLCNKEFLVQIENVAKAHPKAIILREKDLTSNAYSAIAKQVMEICEKYGTPCILHSSIEAARSLGSWSIHLPLHILRNMTNEEKQCFKEIGASCHSVEDAQEAEELGCTYIIVGHIFNTDCKKGVPGRGISFLQSVCEIVNIPVYAIGGIRKENYSTVREAGAAGACIMSGFMTYEDVDKYIQEIENEV